MARKLHHQIPGEAVGGFNDHSPNAIGSDRREHVREALALRNRVSATPDRERYVLSSPLKWARFRVTISRAVFFLCLIRGSLWRRLRMTGGLSRCAGDSPRGAEVVVLERSCIAGGRRLGR
jgi:hypothetical protein